MDIQIEGRNVDLNGRRRVEIEAKVADLRSAHGNLTHVRITLTRHDHKKAEDTAEALIVATLPGRTLTARKTEETFEEAIRVAFTAIDAELDKYREKRGAHDIRATPALLRGVITRLLRDEGFGFIALDSGEQA